MHRIPLARFMIIPAAEMKQTVDHVEDDLPLVALTVFRRLSRSGIETDQNLTVMEGDDISWSRIVKEVGVDLANDLVRDQSDLNL